MNLTRALRIPFGFPELGLAVATGNLEEVKRLVDSGGLLEDDDHKYRAANIFFYAVLWGQFEIVNYVIECEKGPGKLNWLFELHISRDFYQPFAVYSYNPPPTNGELEEIFDLILDQAQESETLVASFRSAVGGFDFANRPTVSIAKLQIVTELLLVAALANNVILFSSLLSAGFGGNDCLRQLIGLNVGSEFIKMLLDSGVDNQDCYKESLLTLINFQNDQNEQRIGNAQRLIEVFIDDMGDFEQVLTVQSFDLPGDPEFTFLTFAFKNRNFPFASKLLKLIVAHKIQIRKTHYTNDQKRGPLHTIIIKQATDICYIPEIIAAGFSLEARCRRGLTPFAHAVQRGDVITAEALLSCGAKIDCSPNQIAQDSDSEPYDDDWDSDDEHYGSLNQKSPSGNLVHLAVRSGNPAMVAFVRKLRDSLPSERKWVVCPNFQTPRVPSPLEMAIRIVSFQPNMSLVHEVIIMAHELMRDTQLNVNSRNSTTGKTALHVACVTRLFNLAYFQEFLSDERVDLNARDFNGATPLHDLVDMSKRSDVGGKIYSLLCVNRAIKNFTVSELYTICLPQNRPIGVKVSDPLPINPNERVDCESKDNSGRTPLQLGGGSSSRLLLMPRILTAIKNEDGTVSLTWHRGCDPNNLSRGSFSPSPLYSGAMHEGVGTYIKYNAQLDSGCKASGVTPLMQMLEENFLSREDRQKNLDVLIEHGASLSHRDCIGRSASHCAVIGASHDLLPRTMDHGADPNDRDNRDRTPLHLACKDGDATLAMLLLMEGANPSAADESGWTPLHTAAMNCRKDCVSMLLIWHANPNSLTNNGMTPLHCLARSHKDVSQSLLQVREISCLEIAEALICAGVDPSTRDREGCNALHMAGLSNNQQLVRFLLGHILGDGSAVVDPAKRIRLCDPILTNECVEHALVNAQGLAATLVIQASEVALAERVQAGNKRPREYDGGDDQHLPERRYRAE